MLTPSDRIRIPGGQVRNAHHGMPSLAQSADAMLQALLLDRVIGAAPRCDDAYDARACSLPFQPQDAASQAQSRIHVSDLGRNRA